MKETKTEQRLRKKKWDREFMDRYGQWRTDFLIESTEDRMRRLELQGELERSKKFTNHQHDAFQDVNETEVKDAK